MVAVRPSADTEPDPAIRAGEAPAASPASQRAGLSALLTLARPIGETGRGEPARPALPRAMRRLPWPLLAVLVVQSALSLRLVWSIGAYGDEGLYIWAGHVEWAHWLHGTASPHFGAYLSGSPAVYPPLAALADSIGGLAGARLLSDAFILASSGFLYHTTARLLCDRRAGLCAAVMFGGTGASQFLGAFATYDAMAICMLACATWAGVKAASRPSIGARAMLIIFAAISLALANSAKYVSLLFDPVVLVIIGCHFWRVRGSISAGVVAAVVSAASLAGILITALAVAPRAYLVGIAYTTLSRQHGTFPALEILIVAAGWSGIIVLLALIGAAAAVCTWHDIATRALGAVLAVAPLLVPLAAVHAHLFTSLFKHVGYGEWFGAVLAGYALSSLLRTVPLVKAAGAIRIITIIAVTGAGFGFALAGNQYLNIGPDFSLVLPQVQNVIRSAAHPVIATDDVNVAQYYIADFSPATQVFAIGPNPQWAKVDPGEVLRYGMVTGDAAYAGAIDHGYLTEVILSGYHLWSLVDDAVRGDLIRSGRYRLAASVPYTSDRQHSDYQIWVLK